MPRGVDGYQADILLAQLAAPGVDFVKFLTPYCKSVVYMRFDYTDGDADLDFMSRK